MDVSELRKRILRALDDARKDAVTRRTEVDEAARAYEQFLETLAVPLLKQARHVLRAEKQLFTVHTPAGSVAARLGQRRRRRSSSSCSTCRRACRRSSAASASRAAGRAWSSKSVRSRPAKPSPTLTEDDVAQFLVTEIPKLIVRP